MARAVGLAFGRYGTSEPPQRRQAHAHLHQQHDGEKNNEADDADQQDAVYALQVVLQGAGGGEDGQGRWLVQAAEGDAAALRQQRLGARAACLHQPQRGRACGFVKQLRLGIP